MHALGQALFAPPRVNFFPSATHDAPTLHHHKPPTAASVLFTLSATPPLSHTQTTKSQMEKLNNKFDAVDSRLDGLEVKKQQLDDTIAQKQPKSALGRLNQVPFPPASSSEWRQVACACFSRAHKHAHFRTDLLVLPPSHSLLEFLPPSPWLHPSNTAKQSRSIDDPLESIPNAA
jgi:hypothetical protein